jgi:hypothetical protein
VWGKENCLIPVSHLFRSVLVPEGLHHASTLVTGSSTYIYGGRRVVICLNSKSDISFVLIFKGVITAHRPTDPRAMGLMDVEIPDERGSVAGITFCRQFVTLIQ